MEPISATSILVLVLLLQVKHAVFDGPLQTAWMLAEKGTYGRMGGIAHAGLHGAGSLAALGIYGIAIEVALLLAAIDAVIHYHIDYAKEQVVKRRGWTPRDTYFWWSLAADQTLHHATYLGMAAVIASGRV